ncbi:hypothetical protein [Streptomyces antibioticus]|uniref:hypothetical protein n=1 Tax=Streptomyces antibioticus TaxID=1890 RepID=UPI00379E23CC
MESDHRRSALIPVTLMTVAPRRETGSLPRRDALWSWTHLAKWQADVGSCRPVARLDRRGVGGIQAGCLRKEGLSTAEDDPAGALAWRRVARRRAWLGAMAAVTVVGVAAVGTYLMAAHDGDGKPGGTRAGAGTTASASAPGHRSAARTASPEAVSASPAADAPEAGQEAGTPAGKASSPDCLPVTFKLPTGPATCESKEDICAVRSPYYIKDIDSLCGGPPALQRVNIISEPSTGGLPARRRPRRRWAEGPVRYRGRSGRSA